MAGRKDQQMQEIMERLERGVEELFTSETYTEYLKTMSQFHNYSFNNTLLIALQKPDASLVAGYQAWKKKFNRQVKRGEKGIQIIAPAPIREKEEVEKLDPETNELILRSDGQPETEEVVHTIPRFRVTSVFDISQTEGEPLAELETPELMGSVENFEVFMQAIREVSPVPIRFDEIESGAKGYYSHDNKESVIQNGLSESQTMKTAVHETTHAKLHDRDIMEGLGEQKNQMTKEVEAESVAYTVCQYFGLDTSDYSFPYIAGWSSSMEMKELRTSMDTIRKTAGEFIDNMTEVMRQLMLDRPERAHLEEDDLILKISGSMGSEYLYSIVETGDKEALLTQLKSYHELYNESGEIDVESFLEEQSIHLIPWYDSRGHESEYPVSFYDVEYDYDVGVIDAVELSAVDQAEMLTDRAEYGKSIFSDDDRELIKNFAFKFDDIEETKILIRDLKRAIEGEEPLIWDADDVRKIVQIDIDSLPDAAVGLSEMHDAGYHDDSVLPLTAKRALELHQSEQNIYGLNKDGSRTLMSTEQDIKEHSGMFGIEVNVWDHYQVMEGIHKEREARNLSGNEERYAIYQIDRDTNGRNYQFMGMDFVSSHDIVIDAADYRFIYDGELSEGETLDSLYETFNINHPDDYEGHSLSVSDVVVLQKNNETKAYYVDSVGFVELPDFVQQRLQEVTDQRPDHSDKKEKMEPVKLPVSEPERKEPEAKISFYVAECMEFPVLGEHHDNLTLQEAVQKYEEIPAERMNGNKGIGFCLEDGSIYAGDYELFSRDTVSQDLIDLVPHYKNSPLVQEAIAELEKTFPRKEEKEMQPEQPNEEDRVPSSDQEGTGRKQSVLQALKERQTRLKEQGQKNEQQTDKNHKKGGQEL